MRCPLFPSQAIDSKDSTEGWQRLRVDELPDKAEDNAADDVRQHQDHPQGRIPAIGAMWNITAYINPMRLTATDRRPVKRPVKPEGLDKLLILAKQLRKFSKPTKFMFAETPFQSVIE